MLRGTPYFRSILNRRRCVIVASSLCLALGLERSASATVPLIVELSYVAPSDCPNHAEVIERTRALARNSPQTPVFAKAVITHDAGQYQLLLDVEGGKQRLLSDSCDALVQTLTVILALAVAPHSKVISKSPSPNVTVSTVVPPSTHVQELVTSSSEPHATVTPSTGESIPFSPTVLPKATVVAATKPETSDTRTPQTNTPTTGYSPSQFRLHPTLGILAEYGMLPKVGIGPSIGLWFDYEEFSFLTTAKWLLPEWAQMSGTDQHQGGYISFLGGQSEVCIAHGQARSLRSCVGIEVGDLMGKGSGLTKSQLGHGVWLGGALEENLRLNLSPGMSANLAVGFVIPVKRPAFGFDGYAWRFEPNPWSFRLTMGFLWF